MSLRSGNNKKKAQKYQNQFAFRHNKNSMETRKILSAPLDFLCERCLEKLEWRLSYRKYKPLSTASRCNFCQEKTVLKAYRTICEPCALKDEKKKLCTKCTEPVESYGKPNVRNDPNAHLRKNDPLFDLVKNLKKKYQKTVYRKINEGIKIAYNETKGIVNKETNEIIIPLENFADLGSDDDDDKDSDSDDDNDKDSDDEDKKVEGRDDKKGNKITNEKTAEDNTNEPNSNKDELIVEKSNKDLNDK